jgi:putative transposase
MLELVWLLLMTVLAWARPRHDLVLENLLLRHQLAVLTRPTRARPRARLCCWDKLLWVLACRFCAGWREHLSFVTADTVVRWHWRGWRLFWRWKSRSRGGRPHLGPEIRALIPTMSRENRLWGTERIRGELLKLGIVVSNRSIRRYRWRGPVRSPSQTWRTFPANHAHHPWAADLFTVPTLMFEALHVLVFIAHGRRELVHVNVTANPTAA